MILLAFVWQHPLITAIVGLFVVISAVVNWKICSRAVQLEKDVKELKEKEKEKGNCK